MNGVEKEFKYALAELCKKYNASIIINDNGHSNHSCTIDVEFSQTSYEGDVPVTSYSSFNLCKSEFNYDSL